MGKKVAQISVSLPKQNILNQKNQLKKVRIIIAIIKIMFADNKLRVSLLRNIGTIIKQSKKNVLFVSLVEHLGDVIASEPISRHLRSKYPEKTIIWFTHKTYKEVIQFNPNIDRVLTVTCLSEWIILRHFIAKRKLFDLNISGRICTQYGLELIKHESDEINTGNYYHQGNLLYCFGKSAGIEMNPLAQPHIHFPYAPKQNFIADKYIIIHTSAHSAKRMWNTEGWNNLIRFINHLYPEYKIVEIGSQKQVTESIENYLDYTGIKPIEDITTLIHNCQLYIGIDSGFAHIANALKKDSLILIGHFQNFLNYLPYSGFFMEHRNDIIIYFDGSLCNMPFSYIEERVAAKLNAIA